jgi:hypothetical protein
MLNVTKQLNANTAQNGLKTAVKQPRVSYVKSIGCNTCDYKVLVASTVM